MVFKKLGAVIGKNRLLTATQQEDGIKLQNPIYLRGTWPPGQSQQGLAQVQSTYPQVLYFPSHVLQYFTWVFPFWDFRFYTFSPYILEGTIVLFTPFTTKSFTQAYLYSMESNVLSINQQLCNDRHIQIHGCGFYYDRNNGIRKKDFYTKIWDLKRNCLVCPQRSTPKFLLLVTL